MQISIASRNIYVIHFIIFDKHCVTHYKFHKTIKDNILFLMWVYINVTICPIQKIYSRQVGQKAHSLCAPYFTPYPKLFQIS